MIVIKHYNPKNLGEEKMYFRLQVPITVLHQWKWGLVVGLEKWRGNQSRVHRGAQLAILFAHFLIEIRTLHAEWQCSQGAGFFYNNNQSRKYTPGSPTDESGCDIFWIEVSSYKMTLLYVKWTLEVSSTSLLISSLQIPTLVSWNVFPLDIQFVTKTVTYSCLFIEIPLYWTIYQSLDELINIYLCLYHCIVFLCHMES